jgi:hypothetical protein
MRTSPPSPIEADFELALASDWWPEVYIEPEYPVTIGGKQYRIDFAVPSHRFGIELDGHATHSSTTAIAHDRQRQRALERQGWTICRFGGQEVHRNARACVWEAKVQLSAEITDEVSDRDRAWFKDHPSATRFLRHVVPGEVATVLEPGAMAVVSKIPGGRVRQYTGKILADCPAGTACPVPVLPKETAVRLNRYLQDDELPPPAFRRKNA